MSSTGLLSLRVVCPPAARDLLRGSLLGALLTIWCSQFTAAWGAGLEAATALTLVLGVCGCWLLRPSSVSLRDRAEASLALLVTAGWVLAAPWLLVRSVDLAAVLLGDRFSQPEATFAAGVLAAACCIAPGVIGAAAGLAPRQSRLLDSGPWWCGAAAAAWLSSVLVAPWWGLRGPSGVLGALCVVMTIVGVFRRRPSAAAMNPSADAPLEVVGQSMAWPEAAGRALIALGAGVCCSTAWRLQAELFLTVSWLVFASAAGVLLGMAWGLRRRGTSLSVLQADALLLGGAALLGAAAAFPLLGRFAMSVSASVSWLPGIVLLRSAAAMLLALPWGVLLGWAMNPESVTRDAFAGRGPRAPVGSLAPGLGVLWFSVGLVSARWGNLPPEPLRIVFLGLLIAAGAAMPRVVVTRPSGVRRIAWPVLAVVLVASCWRLDRGERTAVSRCLFSAAHIEAASAETPLAELLQLDDSRLVELSVSPRAAWSLWRRRGAQVVLRQNGVIRSVASTDARLHPQAAAEVLPAAAVLSLHRAPRDIALLGAVRPVEAAICLSFPVQSVSVFDADPVLLRMAQDTLASIRPQLQDGDDRLVWRRIDPLHAMARTDRSFDVILAPPFSPADWGASPLYGREHFRRIAARLRPEGLFCQSLDGGDLDANAVLAIAATMRSEFAQVQLSEIAPGAWMLLGAVSDAPLIDDELPARLERAHAREALAQAGWDWSIVLGMRTISPEAMTTLVESGAVMRHSVANPVLAHRLPVVVMRWGPKSADRQAWLAAHGAPLAAPLGEHPGLVDASHRLGDVQLALQVAVDHPDHGWAYRRWLKQRLQDRPRTKIIQVKNEGLRHGRHPEDTRRLEYLAALGSALEAPASLGRLTQLESFATPFDPLVSPFLDRELATLEERAAAPRPAAAWRHWVHSVYFAPDADRSVRNVCSALKHLQAHPEIAGDSLDQWDHVNGLLEVLAARWRMRMQGTSEDSRFDAADAQASLEVIRDALALLDRLQPQTNISADAWRSRRTRLERELVRPVRTWRSTQAERVALLHSATRSNVATAVEASEKGAAGDSAISPAAGSASGAARDLSDALWDVSRDAGMTPPGFGGLPSAFDEHPRQGAVEQAAHAVPDRAVQAQ